MQDIALLAIDWGTSSTRVYAMDRQGLIRDSRSAPLGVQRVASGEFAQALETLRGDAFPESVPLIACGMIGSRQGWIEAPYCACPADFDTIAAALTRVPGTALSIVPGLICRDDDGIADVMRGEETQIFGALAGDAGTRQVLLLPGTHSKWAIIGPDGIETFSTFMTGELYAVLREHSILGRLMPMEPVDESAAALAFEKGLEAARVSSPGDLGHQLFAVRTLGLTGRLPRNALADYLSGLLMGHELVSALAASRATREAGAPLVLLGDAALCRRYARALKTFGAAVHAQLDDTAPRGLWEFARAAGILV